MDIIKDFLLQLALIASLIFTFHIFIAERQESNNRTTTIFTLFMAISILLCMSFPAYITAKVHTDVRIVPLLLGILYGGWRTGLVLSALIIVYRFYVGIDLGLYTTILTLLFSIPVILLFQKRFISAEKKKRVVIALILSGYYCLVGYISVYTLIGGSTKLIQFYFIHLAITLTAVLFFTALNETIKEMLRKNQQLQAEAKEAEIAFLRSQIKPHFLYNALNSIAALCIDAPNKAEELTVDLSQYLRSSFNFKQMDSLTTLENELELVNAYVNIEKARFGTRLSVEYDLEANLNMRIPALIIQPLVENAIRHGLMSSLQGGTVMVSIKKQTDAKVSFSVEDNGCGMSVARREQILEPDVNKKGIGLWNISQRIKLLYGNKLEVESVEGMGTKVFFDIPLVPVSEIGG